jgi:SnoaL-like domain
MDAATLAEIEAIKQLKARYFRLLDTKRWDEWREIFSKDFEGQVAGAAVHPTIHSWVDCCSRQCRRERKSRDRTRRWPSSPSGRFVKCRRPRSSSSRRARSR